MATSAAPVMRPFESICACSAVATGPPAGFGYRPGAAPLLERPSVPVVVIGPPVRSDVVATDVTVPPPVVKAIFIEVPLERRIENDPCVTVTPGSTLLTRNVVVKAPVVLL